MCKMINLAKTSTKTGAKVFLSDSSKYGLAKMRVLLEYGVDISDESLNKDLRDRTLLGLNEGLDDDYVLMNYDIFPTTKEDVLQKFKDVEKKVKKPVVELYMELNSGLATTEDLVDNHIKYLKDLDFPNCVVYVYYTKDLKEEQQ